MNYVVHCVCEINWFILLVIDHSRKRNAIKCALNVMVQTVLHLDFVMLDCSVWLLVFMKLLICYDTIEISISKFGGNGCLLW